jgi:hypothetical protein
LWGRTHMDGKVADGFLPDNGRNKGPAGWLETRWCWRWCLQQCSGTGKSNGDCWGRWGLWWRLGVCFAAFYIFMK